MQRNEASDPPRRAAAARAGWPAWYMVGVIVLMVLLSYIDRAVLTLFGPAVQRTLILSDTQMGLLYGLGFIGPLALATLVVGWAIDRYNRVLLMLAGLLFWSLMTAACGLAGSYGWLLAARGGVGAGEAVLGPAGYALIADRFPPEKRGRAVGAVAAAVSVGTGAALIVGGMLLQALGPDARTLPALGTLQNWQVGFLILGALGLPVALLVLTLRDPRPAGSGARQAQAPADWAFVRRHRTAFLAVFLCGALNVAVGTGVVAWSPTLLVRRFDLLPADAGYMLGLMSILGGVIGAPAAAELSDRWIGRRAAGGRLRGHPAFFALMALGVAVLAVSPHPYVAAAGLLAITLPLGAINALSYASIQDLAPSAMRGRLLAALQFTTLACGYGVGPSLIAAFTDHLFGDRAMLPWSLLAAGLPLCAVGALIGWFGRSALTRADAAALPPV